MLDIASPSFLALHAVLLYFACKTVDCLRPQYIPVARADDEMVATADASDDDDDGDDDDDDDDDDDNNDDGAEAPSLLTGSSGGTRDYNPYIIYSLSAYQEPASLAPSAGAGFWSS